ncbi:MAG: hypothetical protein Q8Q09_08525 [Deltaproteobacteria bacterium]|nr:hypothetical protein [Deltaproteobacteria bacterium]
MRARTDALRDDSHAKRRHARGAPPSLSVEWRPDPPILQTSSAPRALPRDRFARVERCFLPSSGGVSRSERFSAASPNGGKTIGR